MSRSLYLSTSRQKEVAIALIYRKKDIKNIIMEKNRVRSKSKIRILGQHSL